MTKLEVIDDSSDEGPVLFERDDARAHFVVSQNGESVWLPYADIEAICDWLRANVPSDDA